MTDCVIKCVNLFDFGEQKQKPYKKKFEIQQNFLKLPPDSLTSYSILLNFSLSLIPPS